MAVKVMESEASAPTYYRPWEIILERREKHLSRDRPLGVAAQVEDVSKQSDKFIFLLLWVTRALVHCHCTWDEKPANVLVTSKGIWASPFSSCTTGRRCRSTGPPWTWCCSGWRRSNTQASPNLCAPWGGAAFCEYTQAWCCHHWALFIAHSS